MDNIQIIETYLKEDPNHHPFVSVPERPHTDEHKEKVSRADTLKPLPPDPPSRFWIRQVESIHFVGPSRSTIPCQSIVLLHVAFLIVFFGFLSLVSKFPVKAARIAFASISGFGFVLLLGTVILDATIQSL